MKTEEERYKKILKAPIQAMEHFLGMLKLDRLSKIFENNDNLLDFTPKCSIVCLS